MQFGVGLLAPAGTIAVSLLLVACGGNDAATVSSTSPEIARLSEAFERFEALESYGTHSLQSFTIRGEESVTEETSLFQAPDTYYSVANEDGSESESLTIGQFLYLRLEDSGWIGYETESATSPIFTPTMFATDGPDAEFMKSIEYVGEDSAGGVATSGYRAVINGGLFSDLMNQAFGDCGDGSVFSFDDIAFDVWVDVESLLPTRMELQSGGAIGDEEFEFRLQATYSGFDEHMVIPTVPPIEPGEWPDFFACFGS